MPNPRFRIEAIIMKIKSDNPAPKNKQLNEKSIAIKIVKILIDSLHVLFNFLPSLINDKSINNKNIKPITPPSENHNRY